MTRIAPLFFLFLILSALPAAAAGFANGVKIGEVTESSAVIWVRLTAHQEALRQVEDWDEEEPKQWSVPGRAGLVTLNVESGEGAPVGEPQLGRVEADGDFCHQFRVTGLKPDTSYRIRVGADGVDRTITGSFRTAPAADAEEPITFVVSTCQDFPRRDDKARGHRIYQSMLQHEPRFFVQTGDTLYYDKAGPLAKDIATARYKWNRLYALPNLREFHRQVPSYWLHDDHDVLKNDCWPGQRYGDLTWEQGLKVWREQIPQSAKPYRTFRWGRHVQVWFPEGREFRTPNTMPDGPEKSILGAEQWQWLEETMRASEATFKFFVSATPVVGPDRKNKNDNHANAGFAHEGARLRKFLASIPGCVVINGDRHWQYHSVDQKTGLHEFGSGPASDQHAGGWKQDDQRPEHRFLRVKGGYLSAEVTAEKAVLRHHDVSGKTVYTATIAAPTK